MEVGGWWINLGAACSGRADEELEDWIEQSMVLRRRSKMEFTQGSRHRKRDIGLFAFGLDDYDGDSEAYNHADASGDQMVEVVYCR